MLHAALMQHPTIQAMATRLRPLPVGTSVPFNASTLDAIERAIDAVLAGDPRLASALAPHLGAKVDLTTALWVISNVVPSRQPAVLVRPSLHALYLAAADSFDCRGVPCSHAPVDGAAPGRYWPWPTGGQGASGCCGAERRAESLADIERMAAARCASLKVAFTEAMYFLAGGPTLAVRTS